MTIHEAIAKLVAYGLDTGLIEREDAIYAQNRMLDVLRLSAYEGPELQAGKGTAGATGLEPILKTVLDYAAANGLLEADSVTFRDLFDTKIMDCLTPRPSEVISKFRALYAENPRRATDWYYKFSQDTDYIRRYRIAKDVRWIAHTEYGALDITINLSKPEKDPKAIAAALSQKQVSYPKCQLCAENVGYAGRSNHPARNSHRTIPMTIRGAEWYLQYSPYVYYNEHCIAFHADHHPMVIDRSAFDKLFDFVGIFPHYFIGSNADLPIVGGSILTHEHFQGGNYEFAMARAKALKSFSYEAYTDVEAEIVKWPMSVIRLRGKDTDRITELGGKILDAWRAYSDESADILASTEGIPHNTITPIARKRGEFFEIDLVLRNNRTTAEHPDGLFHPHREHHHIKKENIGLIEVMGLAILPARLLSELADVKRCILDRGDASKIESIAKHADWIADILSRRKDINASNINAIVDEEVGLVFMEILEQAGVFKQTPEGIEAFMRFVRAVGTVKA
jgi:UDPglucose--hexose-1-phosphate uridylyltransferase